MPVSGGAISPEMLAASVGLKWANQSVPAGNTVTTTTETPFSTSRTIPGNTLAVGAAFRTTLYGRYTPVGLMQAIVPRLRLGGANLLPELTIMGLLGVANSPWSSDVVSVVTAEGIVSSGRLYVADNVFRLYSGPPITGINLAIDNALTASAQWGGAGNAITLQGFLVEAIKPIG